MDKDTVTINKKIIELEKIIETSSDIIVPDSKPDIINIIDANSNSYICNEDFVNGKYRIEGNSIINITYLSDKGEMQCIQSKINFMEFFENENLNERSISKYKIYTISTDAKMLNERKFNILVKIKIEIEFFEKNDVSYFNDLSNIENIEKLEKNLEINTIVVQNKINTNLKEEIELDENKTAIEIVKNSIEVTNFENKISYNKLLAKADVNIKILYLDQNMKIDTFNKSVPITSFIDMEKIKEDNNCDVNYKIRNVNLDIDNQNNNKINCKIDFEIQTIAYEKKEITIIQDMYGINKNIEYSSKEINVQICKNQEINNVVINENIFVEDIRKIFDVEYDVNIIKHSVLENHCNYEAELKVEIYYDTGNYLCVKKINIPFMFKMDEESNSLEYSFTKKHFKLINEDVVIELGIDFKSNTSDYENINLIYDVKELDEKIENDYSMIVYFVKPGDNLWKIAKDFKMSLNKLIDINNLDANDKIYPGDKLYILK